MNEPSKNLAHSLEQLKKLQDEGMVAIKSKMMSRTDRERLTKHGFLVEVMKGWYISSSPGSKDGDTTPWYTSYWFFCSDYFTERFENDWCLSAEQSIKIHVGDLTVPTQLLIRAPNGRNRPTQLLYNTSVLELRTKLQDDEMITTVRGLRVYTPAASLVYCAKNTFSKAPLQVRALLSMVTDASEVLRLLIGGGYVSSAGRLAGAFRNIGRSLIADNIIKGMSAADYQIKEENPFSDNVVVNFGRRDVSPYVNRIRLMWQKMRSDVVHHFPSSTNKRISIQDYLKDLEDRFVTDAYHSLSIEGYQVTKELIEHVQEGNWNPEQSEFSRKHLDAMAAKGYWEAFKKVKLSVEKVLKGESPGEVFESDYSDWYLSLFSPSVHAGIVKSSDLAGYRTGPVYIKGSMHVPPSKEAVRDMMPALFDLLIEEKHCGARAVLGHFIFVFIHPYVDGNGRMGRFVMNLMMASGGLPWLVIPVERRCEYMQALESASVDGDIVPFTKFLASVQMER